MDPKDKAHAPTGSRSQERGDRMREAVRRAVEALNRQKRPCVGPDGRPAIITPAGDRCPVGWLLGEDEAWALQETEGDPSSLDVARMIFGEDAGDDEVTILELLRLAHDDGVCFPDDFVYELERALERIERWLSA